MSSFSSTARAARSCIHGATSIAPATDGLPPQRGMQRRISRSRSVAELGLALCDSDKSVRAGPDEAEVRCASDAIAAPELRDDCRFPPLCEKSRPVG
jgi:hypothetical protein